MKILFLGTGAADYNYETDAAMPGYRRNSSILIDNTILIDPGPCVPEALAHFGVDAGKIEYVIATHYHDDHFNEDTLEFLRGKGARFVEIAPGKTLTLGEHTITAVSGNHKVPVVHYLIEHKGKRLFYGLDAAWLLYPEIELIWEKGADMAVLDGTIGFVDGDHRIFEHCNMNMIIEIKKTLDEHVGKFYISHMAKTLHTDHDTLAKTMSKYGVEVAYDGLEILL